MLKRTTLAAIGMAGLALVVMSSVHCGGSGSADSSSILKTAPGDSDVAPDFTLADMHGNEFTLSETAGRVRLIDFWATWCAPCREEIPMLKELQKTYAEQGLTVVAISDEDSEIIDEFVTEQGIEYTNLCDSGDVAAEYLVLGLPTAFLLDREGKIVERYTGPKPHKVLEADIRKALELPPAT